MSEKNNRKFAFFLTLLLVGLAPFHAFFITFLRNLGLSGTLNLVVSSWREILVVLIAVILSLQSRPWRLKQFFVPAKDFLKKNLFVVLFLLLGFVFLFFENTYAKWLWGARFDLFFFIVFLVFQFLYLETEDFRKLLNVIFITGFIVTAFGLMHSLILPQDFLTLFGYSINRDIWDISTPISACQYLEHTQKFCRAISTFGGPTRYGTYLLLLLSFSSVFFFNEKEKKQKIFLGLLSITALLNIFLTFSRSIWIGLAAMITVGLILVIKQHVALKKILILLFALAVLFLIFIFLTFDSAKTIFLRESSTAEHFQFFKDGISVFLKNPFGIGLGEAGPASLHFKKFIIENWYLQIAIEMGFLGIIFFLGALMQILKNLYARIKENTAALSLFMAIIGIAAAGLFTHSFEETSTVIILFLLTGLLY